MRAVGPEQVLGIGEFGDEVGQVLFGDFLALLVLVLNQSVMSFVLRSLRCACFPGSTRSSASTSLLSFMAFSFDETLRFHVVLRAVRARSTRRRRGSPRQGRPFTEVEEVKVVETSEELSLAWVRPTRKE